jgi:hypothetical protein
MRDAIAKSTPCAVSAVTSPQLCAARTVANRVTCPTTPSSVGSAASASAARLVALSDPTSASLPAVY